MGSGSLSKGKPYGPGTYVGSRGGECVCLQKPRPGEPTRDDQSAYAKAFMNSSQMKYYVLPELFHVIWCCFWTSIGACVQRSPVVIALLAGKAISGGAFDEIELWKAIGSVVVGLYIGYSGTLVGVLFIDIGCKWLLIGRREKGQYNWDQSSYCQRWQLYLSIVPIRHFMAGGRDILECFLGSWFLVAYYRMLGAKIGNNVCLYPNGADPMMTEPEMVTIEKNACIDSAMLIAHLNTAGNFSLGELTIGENCVMRTWARLQQGSEMKKRSMLMEHTLILPGEQVPAKNLVQGWPAVINKSMGRGKLPVIREGHSGESTASTAPLLSSSNP